MQRGRLVAVLFLAGSCGGAGNGMTDAAPPGPQVALYRAVPVTVTVDRAVELASGVFGTIGTVNETAQTFSVTDGARSLALYKASGAIAYRDESKLHNPEYTTALTETQAVALADDFLATNGLLPPEAARTSAAPVEAAKGAPDVVNHWLVVYGFELDSAVSGSPAPVTVSGAEIRVRVGQDEVVGLNWLWRAVERDGTAPLLAPAAAVSRAVERGLPQDTVADPILFYDALAESASQERLAPMYLVTGTAGAPGLKLFSVTVPASDVVPTVRISADRRSVVRGESINLHAEVTGGVPPYEITWLVRRVGEDREEIRAADITLTLPAGTFRIGTLVRDAEGTTVREEEPEYLYVSNEDGTKVPEDDPPPTCTGVATKRETRFEANGWSGQFRVTPHDGFEAQRLDYRGHRLATSITDPSYFIETNTFLREVCELQFPSPLPGTGCRSILEPPGIVEREDEVEACYCVENLPAGDPCSGLLYVCVTYELLAARKGCPPFDGAQCAEYRPWYSWIYHAPPPADCPAGNRVRRFEARQRFDFDVPITDVAAFYQDFDDLDLERDAPHFITPPAAESSEIMANFGAPGTKDNYHQKAADGDPVTVPGCTPALFGLVPNAGDWDCSHAHWRWAAWVGPRWGMGEVLPPSSQQINALVVLFHPGEVDGVMGDIDALAEPEAIPDADTGADLVLYIRSVSTNGISDLFGWNDWFIR